MKRTASILLIVVLTCDLLFAGLDGDKAQYVGGTAAIEKELVGTLTTDNPSHVSFLSTKKNVDDWSVPYEKVSALAYGQHAGRRIGSTVALGVTTLGIGALPVLFSKKRRHYLTIEYADDKGATQAAVFEVGKNSIRTILKSLEVRTGKKIEYEDEEAKKAGNK